MITSNFEESISLSKCDLTNDSCVKGKAGSISNLLKAVKTHMHSSLSDNSEAMSAEY